MFRGQMNEVQLIKFRGRNGFGCEAVFDGLPNKGGLLRQHVNRAVVERIASGRKINLFAEDQNGDVGLNVIHQGSKLRPSSIGGQGVFDQHNVG